MEYLSDLVETTRVIVTGFMLEVDALSFWSEVSETNSSSENDEKTLWSFGTFPTNLGNRRNDF